MSGPIDRKFATWPLRTEDQREYELEVRYKAFEIVEEIRFHSDQQGES